MIKNVLNFNLGERIRKFRKLNHLSINDVQYLFYQYDYPVSKKVIYKWEENIIRPDLTSIIILCQIFNITASSLLLDQTEKKQNLSRHEMKFLLDLRTNKLFKKFMILLSKKEELVNVKDRNKTSDTKTLE